MQQRGSVAIVGIGGIFPDAPDLTLFWENIRLARSASREVAPGKWRVPVECVFSEEKGAPDKVYSRRACLIDALPPVSELDGLSLDPKLLDGLDPLFHLLLHAGQRAFRDGVHAPLDRSRVGVIVGNLALPSESSALLARDFIGRTFREKLLGRPAPRESKNPLNRYVAGLPAGLLAHALELGGGSYTLDAACASSLYAIKLAVDELLSGRADAMLTGGVSRPDPLYTQMGFSQLRALSRRGICSPFDAAGDGLVVGEGAGIFLLKRTEDAIAHGDRIYGVIRGIGLSNDVGGSLLAPLSEGQLRAMRSAYAQAGWQPQDVDLIECHAAGTQVGDAIEFSSLQTLWNGATTAAEGCVIGSVKSNIGHLLTAAGGAALTKVLLAMQQETLPPTANFTAPPATIELEKSPFRVLQSERPWTRRSGGAPRRAAVSAFGFGGINAHLLVEEYLPQEVTPSAMVISQPPPLQGEGWGGDGARADQCDIAIVGLDARFGSHQSLRGFQEQVLGGTDAKPAQASDLWGAPLSDWFRQEGPNPGALRGHLIDEVSVAAEDFRIAPKEMEEMLPQQLLMLQSAAAAMADAGLGREEKPKCGVFIGIALDLNSTNFSLRWTVPQEAPGWAEELGLHLSPQELQEWIARMQDALSPPLTANRTMGALGSIVASRIAREFRMGGPSFTLSNEEGSGMRALESAVRMLQGGELDRALVGAVDLAADLRALLGHHEVRPLSASGTARPFDTAADGSILGEGAAALVLKRLDDAKADGDRIYAVIKGLGSAGGKVVLPGEEAYHSALERAYRDAQVDPATVNLLEAHGSGNADEDRMEARALAHFFRGAPARSLALSSAKGYLGHTGAACALTSLVRSCLALYQEIIPPSPAETPVPELAADGAIYLPRTPRYWLRNRADGPRRAGVSVFGVDGSCSHVVLEGWEEQKRAAELVAPTGLGTEALFSAAGDTPAQVASALGELRRYARENAHLDLVSLSAKWHHDRNGAADLAQAAGVVARSREDLEALIDQAERVVAAEGELDNSMCHPALRDRIFYSVEPTGKDGKLAFVFPGSGNHFAGMGGDVSGRWPQVFRRQDAENLYLASQFQPEKFWNGASAAELNDDHEAVIFGQVATGCAYSDLVRTFGVEPRAVIGYSLGESAGFFSTRTWRDRDMMLARMQQSTLFTRDLAGECRAAQRAWGQEGKEVEWSIGVVDVTVREVRRALRTTSQVYLLIVNTPEECVIGGNAKWVKHLVAMLGCRFFPLEGVTTVHCEVAQQVARSYRDLHLFKTTPPEGITFYSGARGGRYEVTRDSAADSILAQAVSTIDFPRVVRAAYQDGVRQFIEMGPGGSCSRMIGRILRDQPHMARSVSLPAVEGNSAVLRLLAQLVAERVPVNLEPLFESGRPVAVAKEQEARLLVKVPTGGKDFAPELPARSAALRETVVQVAVQVEAPVVPVAQVAQAAVPAMAAAPVVAALRPTTPPPLAPTSTHVGSFTHPPTPSRQGRAGELPVQAPAAPDLLLAGFAAAQEARMQAHAAYLSFADTLARCTELIATGFPLAAAQPAPAQPMPVPAVPCAYDRAMCLEFAIGSVARMLGPEFAEVDSYPTRVRLPDEPLMLVDRIVSVEGEPRSMTRGQVVTEHDIHPGAWYLDGGRIPTCIAVEAGQADLFLSGYLGIDFITKGLAVYRLLDAVVTFHRELPRPGETIRYDIHIERFFRQGDTYLFRFHFEATVNGAPLLSMRDGCAGFFSEAELAAGKGIVHGALDLRPRSGNLPADWQDLVEMKKESYSFEQLERLRAGDLAGCFGPLFAGLPIQRPLTIPSGRMQLVHRVMELIPRGGRYQLGYIRAEADIHPDDWFLTCHFVDDRVMPGTLMYECCLHTLRIFLLRMGWVCETDGCAWVPVPGVASRLCCRGQVLETTKVVAYEVNVRELGYGPEPYAIVDALMYADGRPIVEITSMSVRLSGSNREVLNAIWRRGNVASAPTAPAVEFKPALYSKEQILAYSNGKPSEGFGDRYRVFDADRKIARLPGPPFQFMDRVTSVTGAPWQMTAGARVESQYLVPVDAWYFAADRQPLMPFAVLLEAALQPCGWLAAYVGSALTSPSDLSFRNLGGSAVQHRRVTPQSGILTAHAAMTKVAASGGMIIQEFELRVEDRDGVVYEGETMFGFFSKEALANQVGIRDAAHYQPTAAEIARGESLPFPAAPPFPDTQLRMIDTIDLYVADGGPKGLGYVRGVKQVDPGEWFFKAHFYEDPVTPGSLGLESFLQLVRFAAVQRWGWREGMAIALATGSRHRWVYRGQVVPSNGKVTVEATITAVDDLNRVIVADGLLSVDGRPIYQMKDFAVQAG